MTWLRTLWARLRDAFWTLPALLVASGLVLASYLVQLDRSGVVPEAWIAGPWLYSGGGTGARTLLGVVASSTIGVAGTAFSITIAALSLAAGQMGPRLLRNFTRDRGNQATLGAFLGTFVYALTVLRSVRTTEEGAFTPHIALSVGILLAIACVGMLVYFVGHVASRINVDTVVNLVSDDVRSAMDRLTVREPPVPAPQAGWDASFLDVPDERRGYLQHLDEAALADWASRHGVTLRLLVRAGDYVFPGAAFARISSGPADPRSVLRSSTALGSDRASSADLEYAVRQLVEVAVRALSPGINDPHTAMSVLDRLGAALCDVARTHLPSGVTTREGRIVLVVPAVEYGGLTDSMFHSIRQNAAASPAVLIRMVEVLTAVAGCEKRPERLGSLRRHVELVLADAERTVPSDADLRDVKERYRRFLAVELASLTDGSPHDEA